MVEPQIVVLDVAGSSPVDHPTFILFAVTIRPPAIGTAGMTPGSVPSLTIDCMSSIKRTPQANSDPLLIPTKAGHEELAAMVNRRRNSAQAWAMSGALRMAETTQTRVAPAASTAARVCKLMPPMANHGTVALAAAQRT